MEITQRPHPFFIQPQTAEERGVNGTKMQIHALQCRNESLFVEFKASEIRDLRTQAESLYSKTLPLETICYWATVCKTVRPMLSDRCPVCPVCL